MRKIIYSGVLKTLAVILLIACMVMGSMAVVEGILCYTREGVDIYSFENDFSESRYLAYLLSIPEELVFGAYGYDPYTGETEGNGTVGEDTEGEGTSAEEDFSEEDTVEEGTSVEEDTVGETDREEYTTEAETLPQQGSEADPQEHRNRIAEILARRFEKVYDSDKINYYVQWNQLVFTNCGAESEESILQGDYYSYFKRDSDGSVERRSTVETPLYFFEDTDCLQGDDITIVVACSVKEEAAAEYKAIWEYQESIVIRACMHTLICIGAALLLLIYLLCVCGKNAKGEYGNLWVDHIWLEVHLTVMAGAVVGVVALCFFVMEEFLSGQFPLFLIHGVIGGAVGLASLLLLTSLLSMVRNVKTHRFVESSLIFRVLRWILRLLIRILQWVGRNVKSFFRGILRLFSQKTGILFGCMLLIYTAIIALAVVFSLITFLAPLFMTAGILLFLFACFVLGTRAKDLDEVRKGAREVRGGNVGYQIPELKCEDMKALSADINGIAQGLDDAVSAKVKAERMKTELITNVSHDLKTPITSIISYTELLSHMEDLPEEAKDYVAVIAKKGDRLKRLTQDLFDISKAQSGNEDVVAERLDVSLLVGQALGEQDSEIRESGLTFCVNTPKDLYITADGRKMSRVLGNLIQNILKYAMKGTRVFITAALRDGRVELVCKNVSAYPLNFSGEEITGRFVRGDESRTTEGNGLGLAIAKSYTELCGGSFEVAVDGDLFKVILTFPPCDTPVTI